MNEVWKDIEGYEGLYQISSEGRVKSLIRTVKNGDTSTRKLCERILKPYTHSSIYGYVSVTLSKERKTKNYSIHQLIANAFIVNPQQKEYVDHIDGNTLNNSIENLRWVTNRENQQNQKRHRVGKLTGTSWHKRNNKWIARIKIEKKLYNLGYFETELEAHEVYMTTLTNWNEKNLKPKEEQMNKRTALKADDGQIIGYTEYLGKHQYKDIKDDYPFENVSYIKEAATGKTHTIATGGHLEDIIEDPEDHELFISKQVNEEQGFNAVTLIFSTFDGDSFTIRSFEELIDDNIVEAEVVEDDD